ncbi:rho guanine nucleotide exchange factor 15 isoform X2 [Hippocampus zosterae]|uniref:rho guanine nucleotide exchange factor 15 isoform X2 n=1 Tax=Hippocampus zosterae TaxID=109293 RepID=UPI00223CD902|nr:rho guanine nucleotide exchange factor 15 isoform X2 [Hippocampus zosterae]
MSAQEAAQLPAQLAEVKPKPDIPPKPMERASAQPLEEDDRPSSPSGVNVKRIVNKFSKHRVVPAKATQRQMKRQPVVKPKPATGAGTPLHPPPLPKKRTRLPQGKSTDSEDGDGICAEGGRSEPDGREVDAQPAAGKAEDQEVADGSAGPACEPSCSCACHLRRPGMKLVWVPLPDQDGGEGGGGDVLGEEGSDLAWPDGHEEAEEEADEGDDQELARYAADDSEETKPERAKSQNLLLLKTDESPRRLSDPGPQIPAPLPQLHAPAPKHNTLLAVRHASAADEEGIYESIIPTADPGHNKKGAQEAELLHLKAPTPLRRLKPPEIQRDGAALAPAGEDAPPALPPRVPLSQDARSPAEERTSQAAPRPPASPHLPPRPPPPLPKADLANSAAAQRNDGENGGEGGEEDSAEEASATKTELSNSWKSRLQNEPLYQTYRATVITKEIRRQTVCRNISATAADYAGELPVVRNELPACNEGTLWQNLPAVRDSGVLERLSPEQCKYQESMFEVLTSEASYLRSLHVLTDHFLENRELEGTLVIRDKKPLFSNILRIREVSERFLKDLEERVFETVVFSDICDIIHYHSQHNFPAYIDYVRNQIYQEKTFTSLMKNNGYFAAVINRLQESPQCQRLPFMSFLLLPFQRITRIKMLIENILKRTKEGTKEERMASKALASVSKIIDECNTEVGKMRRMEELILISKTLEFDKLRAIPIISQTRFLEKKGELQEMSRGGTVFQMRVKFNPIYVFLFNDLLIVTTSTVKKGSERFVVLDYAHRSLVQVQALEEDRSSGPYENCFTLILLENHNGRMIERLIKAPSQPDMHRWMAAFPNKEEDDVVYDAWDCPQVQCVEQYVAQQADELNLDPTEIVNVIRKTNEGWYEGIRLSDGQKGWFPVGNIIEITNEHVRRRNLKERYRVIQAASQVTTVKKL